MLDTIPQEEFLCYDFLAQVSEHDWDLDSCVADSGDEVAVDAEDGDNGDYERDVAEDVGRVDHAEGGRGCRVGDVMGEDDEEGEMGEG